MMMEELRTGGYEALALGFRRPTPAQIEVLADGDAWQWLSDLTNLTPFPQPIQREHLGRFSEDVDIRGAEQVAVELAVEYCRLFLGPEAVPCPPYGSLYLDRCLMGPSTQDAMGRYRAEGLKANDSWKEPPDHIAVELGFMASLSAACSRAADADEAGEAERLLRAQAGFLGDHVGRWGPVFAERLGRATSCHLYRFLSAFLCYWLPLDYELLRAELADTKVKAECR